VLDRFDQRFDRIEDKLSDHTERIVELQAAKKEGTLKTAGWSSGSRRPSLWRSRRCGRIPAAEP
jgi:hypothetical protein